MATDEDTVYALIRDDTSISSASKTQYLGKLQYLVNACGRGMPWLLRNPEECVRMLTEQRRLQQNHVAGDDTAAQLLPAQTLRAYCCAVSSAFNRMSRDQRRAVGPEALRGWRAIMERASSVIHKKYSSNEASETQRANFVPWEDLIARREQLGADPRTHGGRTHLLLSFLTHLPPMRTSDLGSLRLLRRQDVDAGNYDREELKNSNHVIMAEDHGVLTVNEYKTANHYRRLEAEIREKRRERRRKKREFFLDDEDEEKMRIAEQDDAADEERPLNMPPDRAASRTGPLPGPLFELLSYSLTECPREWVFVNSSGGPFVLNSFNKMVSRDLSAAFEGKKNLTVNLVRHAAATWLDQHHRRDAKLRQYFRKWMMHSQSMQYDYVLRKNMEDAERVADAIEAACDDDAVCCRGHEEEDEVNGGDDDEARRGAPTRSPLRRTRSL